jgi:hypothetical protein
MRFYLAWLAVGAFVGGGIATLCAPFVLETFLASTGAADAMCQCSQLVKNTASLLVKTQLWGALAGAVLFPVAAWLTRRKLKPNDAPTVAA